MLGAAESLDRLAAPMQQQAERDARAAEQRGCIQNYSRSKNKAPRTMKSFNLQRLSLGQQRWGVSSLLLRGFRSEALRRDSSTEKVH